MNPPVETSLVHVKDSLDSILAPVVPHPDPNPFTLHTVRSLLKRGETDLSEAGSEDQVSLALSYLEKEKEVLPPGIPIEEVATGKILAVLQPHHLWEPDGRFREDASGRLIRCEAVPSNKQIKPEVFGYLVVTANERSRYDLAFARWQEKCPGIQRKDLPLAFPEGRNLVAERCLQVLQEGLSQPHPLGFPTEEIPGVGEQSLTPPPEEASVFIKVQAQVSDPLSPSSKYHAISAIPASLLKKARGEIAARIVRSISFRQVGRAVNLPEDTPVFLPLGASASSFPLQQHPSARVYLDIPFACIIPGLQVQVTHVQVRHRVLSDMWQIGADIAFRYRRSTESVAAAISFPVDLESSHPEILR